MYIHYKTPNNVYGILKSTGHCTFEVGACNVLNDRWTIAASCIKVRFQLLRIVCDYNDMEPENLKYYEG